MAEATKKSEVAFLREQLAHLEAQVVAVQARLAALLDDEPESNPGIEPPAERKRDAEAKIAIFRRLFAGRSDVFALRWENAKDGRSGYAPACSNEWVAGVCGKPKIKCGVCPNQAFIPITDDAIKRHLRGTTSSNGGRADYVMGVYPLLQDDTCWFLAADFDGEQWADDVRAYVETCRARNVPAAIERSR